MNSFSIYMISNDTNDKVYIGQTTQSIKDRFESHYNNPSSPMSKIMREIGKDHFTVSLLDDTANNLEELLEKERYYVTKYNSIENGYNSIIPCGTSGRIHHTRKFSTSVKRDLYARLKEYSKKTSIPVSKLLDKAIAMFLETVDK